MFRPTLLGFIGFALALSSSSCGTQDGDPHASVVPNACGQGKHIRDIADPKSGQNGQTVTVTCATNTFTDTFDETRDGKSKGTIYVQDIGSQAPFSGISLFSPSFIPANLHLSPGDVIDLTGQYVELDHIGAAIFSSGKIVQLAKPNGTFRYEFAAIQPVVVDVADLDDPVKGRQWENMLVTVKNITIGSNVQDDQKGRYTWNLDASRSGAVLENELYDMPKDIKINDKYSSITGLVTYFFELHLCPRSPADLVK